MKTNNTLKIICPLCESLKHRTLGKLDSKCIQWFYLIRFKFSVVYLFKGAKTVDVIRCSRCGLIFYNPKVVGDDYYYQNLEGENWYYQEEKYEYVLAGKSIPFKSKVLDVGCGDGKFAKFVPKSTFTGLELNSSAREVGASKGIDIRDEALEDHALENKNTYDAVTMFQVLEHVPNIGEFIKSAVVCLKSGGLLIIAVPNNESFLQYQQDSITNIPPHHQSRWHDKTFEFIAKHFSLELVHLEHEPLSKLHLRPYIRTMLNKKMCEILGIKQEYFNCSPVYRVISTSSHILSFFIAGVKKFDMEKIEGHSVIAIYKKV